MAAIYKMYTNSKHNTLSAELVHIVQIHLARPLEPKNTLAANLRILKGKLYMHLPFTHFTNCRIQLVDQLPHLSHLNQHQYTRSLITIYSLAASLCYHRQTREHDLTFAWLREFNRVCLFFAPKQTYVHTHTHT